MKVILKVMSKKVLGEEWAVSKDEFIFTFSHIIETGIIYRLQKGIFKKYQLYYLIL